MQHSLAKTGLSMTQAQTISNLCNQAANEMMVALSKMNNCSKTLNFDGKMITKQVGVKISITLEDQLKTIGEYRACQAFLMEQIKAKDALLTSAKALRLTEFVAKEPERPALIQYKEIPLVNDQWGWDQLTAAEMAEYWEAEAMAAVIGQFIHKGGTLDRLRKELPLLEPVEWFVAPGHEGKAYPVTISVHHTEMDLWNTHQDLANIHRVHEQKVNYYKAKVKNLVTAKNAEINKDNSVESGKVYAENHKIMDEHSKELQKYRDAVKIEIDVFEAAKLTTIKGISELRIQVDKRFQSVVDELMPKEKEEEEGTK